jgi:hypothetical protein
VYVVAGLAGALAGAGACAEIDTEPAATTAARSIVRLTIRSSTWGVSGPLARQIIRRLRP